jgi:DNA-binding response OmpR family regulator
MIVSGYNSPEDEAQARAAGADDFLARPLDYLDFVNRVKALLNRGEAAV